jgi:hypothetical protein
MIQLLNATKLNISQMKRPAIIEKKFISKPLGKSG